jgi:PAS domain S-box-containing protein
VAQQETEATRAIELAIEASPQALVMVDGGGTIVLVNRELERLFGYSRDELVGANIEMLVPEASREAHALHRQAYMENPEMRAMGAGRELWGRHKSGALVPVEIGLRPTEDTGRALVLAAVSDISERRALAETARAQLAERLDFERLIADVSAQFINLPSDRVAGEMQRALGQIGPALQLDRCTFYRILPDGMMVDRVGWERPGVLALPGIVSGRERFPWVLQKLLDGELLVFSSMDEVSGEVDRESLRAAGTASWVAVPLSVDGVVRGVLSFSTIDSSRAWTAEAVHRLRVVGAAFAQVLARWRAEEALRGALGELERLKAELQQENVILRRETQAALGFSAVLGSSPAIRRVLEQVSQVAPTDSTVLLLGETGSGKELLATQLHEMSRRRARAMVRVNCGAIPATLIESELFGREKGAFTGALARQIGRFELADGSTIFLDEIGDLPSEVQVKLLRVLEERKIERLGSPQSISVDTRIIAATHRNLEQRIKEGAFREDLFYRLNVFPIRVPPLRERVEDIPLLAWRFVEEFSKSFGKRIDTISKESLAALQQYSWPGNIRELRNVIERAMITATGPRLTISLPTASGQSIRRSGKLVDVEREHIRSVLERTGWRIRGTGGAADRLGLKPTTLETRMAKLGLRRPTH